MRPTGRDWSTEQCEIPKTVFQRDYCWRLETIRNEISCENRSFQHPVRTIFSSFFLVSVMFAEGFYLGLRSKKILKHIRLQSQRTFTPLARSELLLPPTHSRFLVFVQKVHLLKSLLYFFFSSPFLSVLICSLFLTYNSIQYSGGGCGDHRGSTKILR